MTDRASTRHPVPDTRRALAPNPGQPPVKHPTRYLTPRATSAPTVAGPPHRCWRHRRRRTPGIEPRVEHYAVPDTRRRLAAVAGHRRRRIRAWAALGRCRLPRCCERGPALRDRARECRSSTTKRCSGRVPRGTIGSLDSAKSEIRIVPPAGRAGSGPVDSSQGAPTGPPTEAQRGSGRLGSGLRNDVETRPEPGRRG